MSRSSSVSVFEISFPPLQFVPVRLLHPWVRCRFDRFTHLGCSSGVIRTCAGVGGLLRSTDSKDSKLSRKSSLQCGLYGMELSTKGDVDPEMDMHVENIYRSPQACSKKQSPKLLTLVIIKKDDKVLLGMKKRGFGAGYFNGFGGKVESSETIEEAAVRELQEECGVFPHSMEKRGILTFHFDDNPQPWEVHVYHVDDFAGEPSETEEMAPRWFALPDIPYDKMWQDDPIWYPVFLLGGYFKGEFYFHNTDRKSVV